MHQVSRPVIAVVLWALLLALPAQANAAGDPPQSPNWTLQRVDGSDFVLKEQIGEKTYLVLFWATWCPYCKALMPHIQSVVLEHAGDDFEVLAISIKDDGDPAKYLADNGYDFTLLPNGDDVAQLYGIRGTPGALIVDKKGVVVFDLRDQPRQKLASDDMKRSAIAARRAPLWAAQIRRALAEHM